MVKLHNIMIVAYLRNTTLSTASTWLSSTTFKYIAYFEQQKAKHTELQTNARMTVSLMAVLILDQYSISVIWPEITFHNRCTFRWCYSRCFDHRATSVSSQTADTAYPVGNDGCRAGQKHTNNAEQGMLLMTKLAICRWNTCISLFPLTD